MTYPVAAGTVYFIGAGPGAPDLITVRGRDILAQADLILYADSLVDDGLPASWARANARIIGTADMHLEQIVALMRDAARAGQVVARLHSGDPSLYGAVHEQMAALNALDIPYEIVPGVTAAFAAASRLGIELTVPEVVQTVIFTRASGRTPMPPGEELNRLAAHGASLAIYLSVTRIQRVVDDLLAGGAYTHNTPVAVLYRVSWPDETIIHGTLGDIVAKVKAAGFTRQALILVSPALDPALKQTDKATSRLYDRTYTHRFRCGEQSGEQA
ncbi:MAG: precorrin-4 C(11)-methyltransferase [Roseiflexus castenholzii]|uniref:precorrin-4 C(11)-methyltransferase n=1 Tax=Roseiflexus castenholzii TaxID=120962 RepID=UPI000CC6B281|nr:MAG: precorrin-4 C(11)-methyltransferase [Roseiflexus castenholzii]